VVYQSVKAVVVYQSVEAVARVLAEVVMSAYWLVWDAGLVWPLARASLGQMQSRFEPKRSRLGPTPLRMSRFVPPLAQ